MPNFSPFLIYVLVTTFTPGPNNILSMTNAVRSGYRKTLPFLLGICAGFAVVMFLSGLLNLFLVSLLPSIRTWLNWLGVFYMVYLAIHVLRSKPATDDPKHLNLNTYKAGFTLQFINLKGILYGVTVFSLFIIKYYSSGWVIAVFSLLLTLVAFVATSTWAFAGNLFRPWLQRYYRLFNGLMAALLIYTAIASLFPH